MRTLWSPRFQPRQLGGLRRVRLRPVDGLDRDRRARSAVGWPSMTAFFLITIGATMMLLSLDALAQEIGE